MRFNFLGGPDAGKTTTGALRGYIKKSNKAAFKRGYNKGYNGK